MEKMKLMKIKRLTLILLVVFLFAGVGVYINLKNAPGEEEYMAAVLAYLEEQKATIYEAETLPIELDPQTGRVIGIYVDSPYTVDRVISWLTKATQVRRVRTIPESRWPAVRGFRSRSYRLRR